ncbi:hypothetical protein [Roseateles sp. MS654]|uniref:hypothetical protein n=1 Tax=Roseateles sp. MS654 TaxID=3412685 RepID=UPI003C306191
MEDQDHSVVTRWGGRAERYREFHGAQTRAHDPFAIQPVRFGHEFHFEAWVLERFAPDTQSITSMPTIVTATTDDVDQLSAKATFVVTRRDGTVAYFLVTKADAPSQLLRQLRRVAKANRAEVVHRTRAEVRARVDEFWFFERLRQAATIWVRRGDELDAQLVAHCASGHKSLADFCALIEAPSDLIRARLARLHVNGQLVINCQGGELVASGASS